GWIAGWLLAGRDPELIAHDLVTHGTVTTLEEARTLVSVERRRVRGSRRNEGIQRLITGSPVLILGLVVTALAYYTTAPPWRCLIAIGAVAWGLFEGMRGIAALLKG